MGYLEYAAWRSDMNGSMSKLWCSHKNLHAALENLERLVHGHDESLPKIRTVCPWHNKSPDIESQKIKTSEYLVAMAVGCAPALGKLSPRDMLDYFKDCDEPIIMCHGNVDITWSWSGGGKSSSGYVGRGPKESRGPNHPTRSPNHTQCLHNGNNKKSKGKEVMAVVAPIEGGDMQLVDHDNVFGAPYEKTKLVDYMHPAPLKCVVA